MSKISGEIISGIKNHLKESSLSKYSDFYIGITKDIKERLFGAHNVPIEGHWFIYDKAINSEHARSTESYFLGLGMKGGDGGGDNSAVYVYCYEIKNYTKE